MEPRRDAAPDVLQADAMRVAALPVEPTALVANLPYNVSVPVLLQLLATFPSIARSLVMVQRRWPNGSRHPPAPDVRGTLGEGTLVRDRAPGRSGRAQGLLAGAERRLRPCRAGRRSTAAVRRERAEVFAVVDAAFAQRRKMLRSALATWAGSPTLAEAALRSAGIDPGLRGERLTIQQFATLAEKRMPVGP